MSQWLDTGAGSTDLAGGVDVPSFLSSPGVSSNWTF